MAETFTSGDGLNDGMNKEQSKSNTSYVDTISPQTICVVGAGNASHAFIPYFSSIGFKVTVFADYGDEAARLKAAVEKNDGILIEDYTDPNNHKEYKGSPTTISNVAADVVPQADFIVVALPSFAIPHVLEKLKTHFKKGVIVYVMPGQGGVDLVAKKILGEQLHSGNVTIAGIIPMPLNCRIIEFGTSVEMRAFKPSYDLASIPAENAQWAAQQLTSILGLEKNLKVNVIGHYTGISLHASNPNIHPGRLYGMLRDYTVGKIYPDNPLFYESWDDISSEYVQAISNERMEVWCKVCTSEAGQKLQLVPGSVPHIKSYIESAYKGYIHDTNTLTAVFNTNDGFKGFKSPMKEETPGKWVPDFKNRYFTEDIPDGFCMYKGIADLAGVATPTIDLILGFFQQFMGKEYLKDGKLAGKDVHETKSPQAFGIYSLDDLLLA